MTAKPALGYPTRTEAVHALRKQGLTTREIAGRPRHRQLELRR